MLLTAGEALTSAATATTAVEADFAATCACDFVVVLFKLDDICQDQAVHHIGLPLNFRHIRQAHGEAADIAEVEHGARRGWLARIAHAGEKVAQSARDAETLRLPAEIALFPERSLNRDLYLWLIAQGAALPADGLNADNWIAANQEASAKTLAAFPGFASRYRRLVAAVLAERPNPANRRRPGTARPWRPSAAGRRYAA